MWLITNLRGKLISLFLEVAAFKSHEETTLIKMAKQSSSNVCVEDATADKDLNQH
jgi:predicted RNA-binding protein Jag